MAGNVSTRLKGNPYLPLLCSFHSGVSAWTFAQEASLTHQAAALLGRGPRFAEQVQGPLCSVCGPASIVYRVTPRSRCFLVFRGNFSRELLLCL